MFKPSLNVKFAPLILPPGIKQPFLVAFFLSALITILSVLGYVILQPEIPLFYSLARPSQHLAPKIWLFLFPGISIVSNLLHFLLLRRFTHYEVLLLRLFAWSTVLLQLLICVALVRIMYITS